MYVFIPEAMTVVLPNAMVKLINISCYSAGIAFGHQRPGPSPEQTTFRVDSQLINTELANLEDFLSLVDSHVASEKGGVRLTRERQGFYRLDWPK